MVLSCYGTVRKCEVRVKIVFLDTETTGLDPERHEVWEVAAVVREIADDGSYEDVEHHWFLWVDLAKADLIALNIGGYFDRHPSSPTTWKGVGARRPAEALAVPGSRFAREFFQISHEAHIVGAVPNFDTERIARILKTEGLLPSWHYHLVCVENLVAGFKGIQPPWKSKDLSLAMDIDPEDTDKYQKHTAMSDARWARDLYDAVMEAKRGDEIEM